MKNSTNEYAEALFALAMETQNEQAYADQLSLVCEMLKQNEEFVALLRSPSVPLSERLQVVETAFSAAVDEYVLSFLMLLTEKGRMGEFFECEAEYRRLLSCKNKTVQAIVRSAKPLSGEQKSKLTEKLSGQCGKTVFLVEQIDPSMLGGIVVELDGKLIDGSLKTKLKQVKGVISQ